MHSVQEKERETKMAQLPPKIPNMTPTFLTSMPSNATNNTNHNHQNPCWVDEFLDFSSAKRGAHRRSMSDSITFVESPMLEDCRGNNSGRSRIINDNEFDRFDDDDEQLFLSMFGDDEVSRNPMMPPTRSSSNPSSPSDHNSINEEEEKLKQQVKNESDEDESQCKREISQALSDDNNNSANGMTFSSDKITEPKRVKRILANRQSAQRSRVRKLQYISELERSVTSLQAEVSVMSPRVAFLDHQRLLLNVDNSALKQRIAALAQDKIFKDAHQEALRREIERLREVYHQQNMKKMESAEGSPSPSPKPRCGTQTQKEHLIND